MYHNLNRFFGALYFENRIYNACFLKYLDTVLCKKNSKELKERYNIYIKYFTFK